MSNQIQDKSQLSEKVDPTRSKYVTMLVGTEYEFLLKDLYKDNISEYYKICRKLTTYNMNDKIEDKPVHLELDTSKFRCIDERKIFNTNGLRNLMICLNYCQDSMPSYKDDNKFIGLCNFITRFSEMSEFLYENFDRVKVLCENFRCSYYACKDAVIIDCNIEVDPGRFEEIFCIFEKEDTAIKRISNEIKGCGKVLSRAIIIVVDGGVRYITLSNIVKVGNIFNSEAFYNYKKQSIYPISQLLHVGDVINTRFSGACSNCILGGVKIPDETSESSTDRRIGDYVINEFKKQVFDTNITLYRYASNSKLLYCPEGNEFIVTDGQGGSVGSKLNILGKMKYNELTEEDEIKISNSLFCNRNYILPNAACYLEMFNNKLRKADWNKCNKELIAVCKNFNFSKESFESLVKYGMLRVDVTGIDRMVYKRVKGDGYPEGARIYSNDNECRIVLGKGDKDVKQYRCMLSWQRIKKAIDLLANSTQNGKVVDERFGSEFDNSDRLLYLSRYTCDYGIESIGMLLTLDIKTGNFLIVEILDCNEDWQYKFEILYVFDRLMDAFKFFNSYAVLIGSYGHAVNIHDPEIRRLTDEQHDYKIDLKNGIKPGKLR